MLHSKLKRLPLSPLGHISSPLRMGYGVCSSLNSETSSLCMALNLWQSILQDSFQREAIQDKCIVLCGSKSHAMEAILSQCFPPTHSPSLPLSSETPLSSFQPFQYSYFYVSHGFEVIQSPEGQQPPLANVHLFRFNESISTVYQSIVFHLAGTFSANPPLCVLVLELSDDEDDCVHTLKAWIQRLYSSSFFPESKPFPLPLLVLGIGPSKHPLSHSSEEGVSLASAEGNSEEKDGKEEKMLAVRERLFAICQAVNASLSFHSVEGLTAEEIQRQTLLHLFPDINIPTPCTLSPPSFERRANGSTSYSAEEIPLPVDFLTKEEKNFYKVRLQNFIFRVHFICFFNAK